MRPLSLLYFMAPAYLANMAPPLVRYWRGWNRPISTRLFGSHKTVVGFALAVVVGVLATAAQDWLGRPGAWAAHAHWLWIGFALGVGVAAGDAIKGLFKRRVGIAPGGRWLPFDQLDFVVGSLLLVWPWVTLSAGDVVLILGATFAGDLLVNRISFALGIKDSPW